MKERSGLRRRFVRMVELRPSTMFFGLGFLPVGLLFLIGSLFRNLSLTGLSWVLPIFFICTIPYYCFLMTKVLPIVDANSSKGRYIAWHIQRYKETFNKQRDDS